MALCLLLALCLVWSSGASATGNSRPSLQQAVDTAYSSAAVSSAPSYHRHYQDLCVRIGSACGIPSIVPTYLRSEVTCCDDEQQNSAQLTVGHCTSSIAEVQWQITQNVFFAGSVTLQCDLTGDADACGPLGCNDLVLSGTGGAYLVFVAEVVDGPAPRSLLDLLQSCRSSVRMRGGDDLQRGLRELVNRSPGLNVTRHGWDSAKASGAGVRQGSGNVTVAVESTRFSIPVTITSKTHNTKWAQGWVDFIIASTVEDVPSHVLTDLEQRWGFPVPSASADLFNTYRFQLYDADKEQY